MTTDKFKVLRSKNTPDMCPPVIPWEMVEPHQEQAQRNHGQSLERLNQRGGLGPEELYAVLQDVPYRAVSQAEAVSFLLQELGRFQAVMVTVTVARAG